MSFPKIGVEALMLVEKFEQNAQRFQHELEAMEKRTGQTAKRMQADLSSLGPDDGLDNLRRSVLENQTAMDIAGMSTTSFAAKLGMLGASVGIISGTFALAGKAIRELVFAGEQVAQIEDVRRSYISLAAASGVSAQKLLSDLQRVSRGTVDTAELMKTANRALLAGGGQIANELPRLYEVAAAAARATGQNTEYVFTTLIKGIVKGSPLLIDNAEVYIQVGKAVDQYAASLGKTTEQLTEQERTQAMLNAVLSQGSMFVTKIGADVEASITPYQKLRTQWQALGDGLRTLVAPAADYVVGSLNSLVFSLQVMVASVSASTKVLQGLGSNILNIGTAVETFKSEFNRALEIVQTGMLLIADTKTSFSELAEAEREAADQAAELSKKVSDLTAQKLYKLVEMEKQIAQQLEDIEIQRVRQLEDSTRQLARQIDDMTRDNFRRRVDLEQDKNRRLAELNEQHASALVEHDREIARRKEELELAHQDRLVDIKRNAWDDITEAARRNDAVEVARAMREQAKAERDERINNNREQRDLSINEEQKRQKLIEAQAQQRLDAQRDYEQRLADLILNEQLQQEQLRLSLQRQAEDRAIAWSRQEEDFQRNKARRLADLDNWYANEREKLGAHLDAQIVLAVEKINTAGDVIAEAATTAMQKISSQVIKLDQTVQRGNYFGGYTTPGTTTSEAWRNRHRYFAAGGTIVADRPTTITMGEAGRELGIFVPERKLMLALTGKANIGFDGLPAGLSMQQVQDLVYRSIARLIMSSL